jgi:hypothetical protein
MPLRNKAHIRWMGIAKDNGNFLCKDCDQKLFNMRNKMGEIDHSMFFSMPNGFVNIIPPYLYEIENHNVTCRR